MVSLKIAALVGALSLISLCASHRVHAKASQADTIEAGVRVNDANTFQELLRNYAAVVVKFAADWCGACKSMQKLDSSMRAEYNTRCKFAEVNVDAAAALKDQYKIDGVPTYIFFKGGKEYARHVGTMDKRTYRKNIEAVLG